MWPAGRERVCRTESRSSGCVGHAGKYALIFGPSIAWNAVFELFGPWFSVDSSRTYILHIFYFWICQSFQIKGRALTESFAAGRLFTVISD